MIITTVPFGFAGRTEVGAVRELNEDAFWGKITDSVMFLAVADGLGGREHQDLASLIALNEVRRYIESKEANPDPTYLRNLLKDSLYIANRTVLAYRRANDSAYGEFATSLTVCAINLNRDIIVSHAGNTRLYLLRNEGLNPMTTDHTSAQELFAAGKITQEELLTHPERLTLTKAIGASEELVCDSFAGKLQQGDMLLLCTDGVYSMLTNDEIRQILLQAPDGPTICDWIVTGAMERGAYDNLAMLVSYIGF